jgi:hypothetical protein
MQPGMQPGMRPDMRPGTHVHARTHTNTSFCFSKSHSLDIEHQVLSKSSQFLEHVNVFLYVAGVDAIVNMCVFLDVAGVDAIVSAPCYGMIRCHQLTAPFLHESAVVRGEQLFVHLCQPLRSRGPFPSAEGRVLGDKHLFSVGQLVQKKTGDKQRVSEWAREQ